jgi:[protein-PII] uridylyltransferase
MDTLPVQPADDPELSGLLHLKDLADYLRRRRAELSARAAGQTGGLELARDFSDLVDGVMRRMLALACARAGRGAEPDSVPIAVVATGGYGRRELCPFSDVDITFIPHRDGDPLVDRVIKEMFTLLMRIFMDSGGMEVGYAYRLLEDCSSLDHQTTSGLLDARLIAGSPRLFIKFENEFWNQFNPADFIFTKLEERRRQREKAGATPRLVEPNLKEGTGGLRDLQTALWVTQARRSLTAARVRGDRVWEVLEREADVSPEDTARLKAAKEFLFRVRNALHAAAGAERDQLVVTRQEETAARLGYAEEGSLGDWVAGSLGTQSPNHPITQSPNAPPVERFMRDFYTHTANVHRITGDIIRRAENSRLFLGIGLDCKRRQIVPGPALGFDDPLWMLWACEVAQKYDLEFSDDLERAILELLDARPNISDGAQAAEIFTRILASPRGAYSILQRMADIGILGWLLPEVGAVMNLIPYDPSHEYTIGQHTLYVIRNLDALRSAEGTEETRDFRLLMQEMPHPEQLYLAALLHDAGKAVPDRPHSEVGEEMAAEVCRRLRWDEQATANVRFIVRHHLLMAETSRLRDLNLDRTIRDFTAVVDDLDRLHMLYILSYADTNAVGTGVWTEVKGRFLRDLLRRAERALAGEEPEEFDDASLARARRRLLKELSVENLPPEEIAEHVASMPATYILNTDLNEVSLHIGFVRRARKGEPVVDFHDDRGSTFTVVTVCTRDDPEPGLLSKITGVFYASDLAVHSAQVFTRVTPPPSPPSQGGENGKTALPPGEEEKALLPQGREDALLPKGEEDEKPLLSQGRHITTPPPYEGGAGGGERIAIDHFLVDFRGRQLTPGKRKEIAANLTAVLTGQTTVAELLAKRRKPAEIGGPVERLNLRYDLSDTFTVVEVAAEDERAMLYRASGALSRLRWDIHSAKVSLFRGRSVASFYVTGARALGEAAARRALLELMPVVEKE